MQQTARTLANGSAAYETAPFAAATGTDPAAQAAIDTDGRAHLHGFVEWRDHEGSNVYVRRR